MHRVAREGSPLVVSSCPGIGRSRRTLREIVTARSRRDSSSTRACSTRTLHRGIGTADSPLTEDPVRVAVSLDGPAAEVMLAGAAWARSSSGRSPA